MEPVLSSHIWSETKMATLKAGGLFIQVNYSEINRLVVTESGHLIRAGGRLVQVAARAGSTVNAPQHTTSVCHNSANTQYTSIKLSGLKAML